MNNEKYHINKLKHHTLIKNLKITDRLIKISGSYVLVIELLFAGTVKLNIEPFTKDTCLVPERERIVYTMNDTYRTDGIYEENDEYKLTIYSDWKQEGIDRYYRTVTIYDLKSDFDYEEFLNKARNNYNYKDLLNELKPMVYTEHSDHITDEETFRLEFLTKTGDYAERQKTDLEVIAFTVFFILIGTFMTSGISKLVNYKKLWKEIKELIKDNTGLSKEEMQERINMIDADLSIMEARHER